MERKIETERRWLRSVISAAHEPLPKLVWMRMPRDARPQAPQSPAGSSHLSPPASRRAAH